MLVLVGLIAGSLAGALAKTVVFTDPIGILATIALLGVPTMLIASIDWNRDRQDAIVVFGTMLTGTLLTSTVVDLMHDWALATSHFARGHHVVTILIASSLLALYGVRRLAGARA